MRQTDQTAQTAQLVAQFRSKGGQIRKIAKSKKALNNRQIDLLVRHDYSSLAVESRQAEIAQAEIQKRRLQRG